MSHKVLLVDDEVNVLDGLRRALCEEPYEIVMAMSGKEALDVLQSTPIDVVVVDQEMPGMKGTELLGQVYTLYPDTVRFMLTGKATLDIAISAINKGDISRFFTKPCNTIDLAVTIRHALVQKDLMVETRELLRTVRRQSAVLHDLESKHPGITRLQRDAHGALTIDNVPEDIDELIHACREERHGR